LPAHLRAAHRARAIRFTDGYPLDNGSLATAAELAGGIQVVCAAPVSRAALAQSIFCYVTLYLPYLYNYQQPGNLTVAASPQVPLRLASQQAVVPPASAAAAATAPAQPAVTAYLPLLLTFNIAPDPNNAASFYWQPSTATVPLLQNLFTQYPVTSLPCRFTLKPGLLGLTPPARDPYDADSLADLDFFFILVPQRPAYSYLTTVALHDLKPVSLSGIGSQLL
jgi:hypothetical protein